MNTVVKNTRGIEPKAHRALANITKSVVGGREVQVLQDLIILCEFGGNTNVNLDADTVKLLMFWDN